MPAMEVVVVSAGQDQDLFSILPKTSRYPFILIPLINANLKNI